MVDTKEKVEQLQRIVKKLLLERSPVENKRQFLSKDDVVFLLDNAIDALKKDSSTLAEIEPPLVVCGDTHGQFYDLLRLFDHGGWPPDSRYLFLGDYVDRGTQGVDTMCLMLSFKIAYPNDFFLLRGNHECANINRIYGFLDECKRRYSEDIYWHFNRVFAWIPLAALIGGRIFCMHGGLSPELHSLDQIRAAKRPIDSIAGGWMADLLWSDPSPGISGFLANTRGISFRFGEDAVIDFCNKANLDLVVRAHQVVMNGFEFFAQGRMVTLFSAPRYCDQFDNSAAMMVVKPDLSCKIKQLTVPIREGGGGG